MKADKEEVNPVPGELSTWTDIMPVPMTNMVLTEYLLDNGLLATSAALRGNSSNPKDTGIGLTQGPGSRRRHLGMRAIEHLHSLDVLRKYARRLCTYPRLLDQFESFVRSTYSYDTFTSVHVSAFYKTIIVSIHWAEICILAGAMMTPSAMLDYRDALAPEGPRKAVQYLMINDYFHFRPREDGSPGYCYYLDIEFGHSQDPKEGAFYLTLYPQSGNGRIKFITKEEEFVDASLVPDEATAALIGKETEFNGRGFRDQLLDFLGDRQTCNLYVSAHGNAVPISLLSDMETTEYNEWLFMEMKTLATLSRDSDITPNVEVASSRMLYSLLAHGLPLDPANQVVDHVFGDHEEVVGRAFSVLFETHGKSYRSRRGAFPDVAVGPGGQLQQLDWIMRGYRAFLVFYTRRLRIESDWVPLIPVLSTLAISDDNLLTWQRLTGSSDYTDFAYPSSVFARQVSNEKRDTALKYNKALEEVNEEIVTLKDKLEAYKRTLFEYSHGVDNMGIYKEAGSLWMNGPNQKGHVEIPETAFLHYKATLWLSQIPILQSEIPKLEAELADLLQKREALPSSNPERRARQHEELLAKYPSKGKVLILGKCHVCKSHQATLQCTKCQARVCSSKTCQSLLH